MTRISLPVMCEHIDKRFCIFRGLNSNRKSFAAIFIFGFCHRSQLSHFEQLNCSTISFSSHYDWILFFRIYFPTVGTPHWSECPVHAHSFWVLIIYVSIFFFSVLVLPNKAWHKYIKLVTNTIYSCVNPCKFNLHDTKAEVSVLMSINVRSASTPDLQFCCHDSCCRQRLRKQRRMLNNDEDDEMLPKGKTHKWIFYTLHRLTVQKRLQNVQQALESAVN